MLISISNFSINLIIFVVVKWRIAYESVQKKYKKR